MSAFTLVHPPVEAGKGQALPEFALVAPVLLLVLFAIIQFGFMLGAYVGMTNGAREAARSRDRPGKARSEHNEGR